MPTERLAPDAVLAQANLSGTVADIQEPADSPDAGWLVAVDNAANTDVRVSFPTPSGALSGTQTVRVLVRKSATGGSTPTAVVELWESGVIKATVIPTTSVTDPVGVVLTGTFAASVVTNPANVEVRVNGVAPGGKPADRRSIGVGAIEWTANVTAAAPNTGTASGGYNYTGTAAGTTTTGGTAATTYTLTTTATGEAPAAPAPGLNVGLIHDNPTPAQTDHDLRAILEAAGHTVTMLVENPSVQETGYDVVVITESGSSTSQTAYVDSTFGVVTLEYDITYLRMATGAGGAGTSTATWDLVGANPLNSGHPDPLTVLTSSQIFYSTPTASLASGVEVLAVNGTHEAASIVEAGAQLTDRLAAGRRVHMALVASNPSALTAAGQAYFLDLVQWAAEQPSATSTGTAAGAYNYTGTASGSRTSQGTATATLTWTGTATGTRPSTGTTAGSYAYTGTATGAAPTVGTKAGTAAGTYGWVASATGTRPSSGTTVGTYAYAGTASGTAPTITTRAGTATGAYTYTGTAAGTSQAARNITIAASPITTDWAAMPTTANPTTAGPTTCCVLTAGPVETTWTTGPTYLEEP